MKLQYFPGGENDSQKQNQEKDNTYQKEETISYPKTERPQGPFEHSGETSGQTRAEEAEEKNPGQ